MKLPPVAHTCAKPSTASRRLVSGNSSVNQAMAATNSTQAPATVMQRQKMSAGSEVAKAEQNAAVPYNTMLQTSTRWRPKRSVR